MHQQCRHMNPSVMVLKLLHVSAHARFVMLLCVTKQQAFTSFGQYDYLCKYSTLWLPLSKANDQCKAHDGPNAELLLVACRQHEGDGCVDGGGCHG